MIQCRHWVCYSMSGIQSGDQSERQEQAVTTIVHDFLSRRNVHIEDTTAQPVYHWARDTIHQSILVILEAINSFTGWESSSFPPPPSGCEG